ncbi:MAG: class II aldolase/adducin family protein, partial [Clostridia bacterium]|nr:class II aldolase/adducin family protein [Clostridia bacterium]
MDIMQAKLAVIEAGKMLVANGLIARTWGNVSCRISDTEFVITPSGRSYESLTPDEIVKVKIEDLSYEGEIKPSSEKGVHASAYKLRPECNFVIHTHQLNASVVSVLGKDMPVESAMHASVLGSKVPLASYGMPSTKKLKVGVHTAIANNPDSKAVIMSHHGAVCMGKDSSEAFFVAQTLEDACNVYLLKKYK